MPVSAITCTLLLIQLNANFLPLVVGGYGAYPIGRFGAYPIGGFGDVIFTIVFFSFSFFTNMLSTGMSLLSF